MDPKRAAAMAGVMYYMQQEAEELEDESRQLGSRRRRSGWSAYGRNAVARGCQMVQGRRFRGNMSSAGGRGYRPGISRECPDGRIMDSAVVPHASGMQIKK
ncbi:hypothetical protein ACFL4W_01585 [Planctomycetota bacterium]